MSFIKNFTSGSGGSGGGTGEISLQANDNPTAPADGIAKLYSETIADRDMPAFIAADGMRQALQPFLATKSVALWLPVPNGNTMSTVGVSGTPQGTATLRQPTATNMATAARRIGYVSGATASQTGGFRATSTFLWRGSAAGLGGFFVGLRFSWSDAALVATGRGFAGIYGTVGVPTDVNPSTLVNALGIGCDNGDANMQLYAAGAVAQSRIDLGSNFPANTVNVDLYDLYLWCPPSPNTDGAPVNYMVHRLNTDHRAMGTISATARLPNPTTFMTPIVWRGNGGTAAATGVDVGGGYFESRT